MRCKLHRTRALTLQGIYITIVCSYQIAIDKQSSTRIGLQIGGKRTLEGNRFGYVQNVQVMSSTSLVKMNEMNILPVEFVKVYGLLSLGMILIKIRLIYYCPQIFAYYVKGGKTDANCNRPFDPVEAETLVETVNETFF